MNSLKLTDREWRAFKIGDVFDVTLSSGDNQAKKLEDGKFPLVSSGENNNGIVKFIRLGDDKSLLFESNLLTVDMFGLCKVHGYKFYSVSHGRINILTPRIKLSVHKLKFVQVQINNATKGKYTYNYGAFSERIARQLFLLPITTAYAETDTPEPDWKFMEQYIDSLSKVKNSIKLPQKHEITDTRELDEVEWGEWKVSEIFNTMVSGKSKGLNHLEEGGNVPYLGATNRNNGMLTFVKSVEKQQQKGNCIAFIRNVEGSMGYAIYKHEDFIATSDITVAYSDYLNRHTGTFITTIADRVRGKYTFNYKRSDTRLKKETLSLPKTANNTPDWQFMEQYMKRMENNVLDKVVSV
jgi:hypothetical protein